MTAQSISQFIGYDFAWYACDSAGHLGYFTTASCGPLPSIVIAAVHEQFLLHGHISQFPRGTQAQPQVVAPAAVLDDWLAMSQRGLYAYDYPPWDGPYHIIAIPEIPLTITQLDPMMQRLLQPIVIPTIRFAQAQSFDLNVLMHCQYIA